MTMPNPKLRNREHNEFVQNYLSAILGDMNPGTDTVIADRIDDYRRVEEAIEIVQEYHVTDPDWKLLRDQLGRAIDYIGTLDDVPKSMVDTKAEHRRALNFAYAICNSIIQHQSN